MATQKKSSAGHSAHSAGHSDAIRIVPLHHPQALQAAAPQLTYRNGSLLSAVEVFTVFWGSTWNSAPQITLMNNMNAYFDFILTSALIAGAALAAGKSPSEAIVLGASLSLSSTAIVLELLSNQERLTSNVGRASFSVLLAQDLAVIPLLMFISIVAAGSGGLGWYIYENKNQLEIPSVFAGLLTVIVIGLVVESVIFRSIENVTIRRWGMQS